MFGLVLKVPTLDVEVDNLKNIPVQEMTAKDTFQNKVRDYFGFNKSYELNPEELKRYNKWNYLSDTYEGELNNTWQDRMFGGK